jgi:hypothetical protein
MMTKSKIAELDVESPKQLARIAGILYLLVGIFGGFSEGYVDPKMYIPGNARTTAANIAAHTELVRLSVIAHLLDGTFFVILAMVLYVLLKHVNKNVARSMLILVSLAAGIICLNAVFQFEALRVETGAVNLATPLGRDGSNSIALLLLDIQHYGTLVAQVFFGLWLVPLGYLTYKSNWFPKTLAVVLVLGGICYLIDLLAAFLIPDFSQKASTIITIPSAVAEIWMVGYLLIIGIRSNAKKRS